jgi:hypothetical protein
MCNYPGGANAKFESDVVMRFKDYNPGEILKETLKEIFPKATEISVDIKPEENRIDASVFIPNMVDHIDMKMDVNKKD